MQRSLVTSSSQSFSIKLSTKAASISLIVLFTYSGKISQHLKTHYKFIIYIIHYESFGGKFCTGKLTGLPGLSFIESLTEHMKVLTQSLEDSIPDPSFYLATNSQVTLLVVFLLISSSTKGLATANGMAASASSTHAKLADSLSLEDWGNLFSCIIVQLLSNDAVANTYSLSSSCHLTYNSKRALFKEND